MKNEKEKMLCGELYNALDKQLGQVEASEPLSNTLLEKLMLFCQLKHG